MNLLRTGRPPADPDTARAETAVAGERRRRTRSDRGQTAIEFVGTLPLILVTLAVMWQAGLVCYTWVLAGNAADKGVRAAAVAEGSSWQACEQAVREDVPDAWETDVIRCNSGGGDLVTAKVEVKVPLIFPGVFNVPWHATGDAKAKREKGGWGW
ncbi:pilus assembly protein [Streptomyces sp. NBC_00464]|uniref:TadE family protein n=1 Tax=Streptomyces sp. NBC_00464 TaxID=2975751 RepID=UPI002E199D8A